MQSKYTNALDLVVKSVLAYVHGQRFGDFTTWPAEFEFKDHDLLVLLLDFGSSFNLARSLRSLA